MACFHLKNGHICLIIMAPNVKVLYRLQVRMKETEVMYVHAKLRDVARKRGANYGNVFVFLWAYKIKCTHFKYIH